jgi:alkanesulfonate monooxygenase SsuD/methylene tetrahydromethanopterin reductase-like flavin-dependent oxidoreductase (luciferase family)
MRYSIMTEPQLGGTYEQLLAVAQHAEREGLVSFARSDHWYWEGRAKEATDAYATLAGLARETTDIRLCVLVSPITFRHPTVIAKNAATIAQMSGGRFDLGVGTGWNDFEHQALGLPFPDEDERWARFEDAMGYLRAAFGPGPASYHGQFYDLNADVRPKPAGLRLVVGGSGPRRTPATAGVWADEYNLFITNPERISARVEVMRRSAAGRPVEVTAMGQVFVGRTDAEYGTILGQHATHRGLDTAEMEARWRATGQIFGTPGRASEQIEALEKAGVDRIYLQWLDVGDFEGMTAMVEAVRSA